MSYCEVIEFRRGKPGESLECRNAWGGAAFIWSALFDTYLKDPKIPYHNWLGEDNSKLWALHARKDIEPALRNVLRSTFDYALVYRKDFKRFAGDLRYFVTWAGTRDAVCHLLAWADFIERSKAQAVGFYHTSVAENPWYDYSDEAKELVPYDLKKGTKHFDVYAS